MAFTADARLEQAFSITLEQRSPGYQDLVSNSNVFTYQTRKKGGWRRYSGVTIRERLLYDQTGTYVRFADADYFNTQRKEQFADAEFEPMQAAVSIVITGTEKRKNSGRAKLEDLMTIKVEAGEQELEDRFCEDAHSAGTAANQVGGLQKMLPTNPAVGTYGGISRATQTKWRPTVYDMDTDFGTDTQFTAVTAQRTLLKMVIDRMLGKKGPTDIFMSTEHFEAYSAAITAIQRVNDENELGKMGFANLRFYGAGRSIEVVLEGGIGSAMPANTSYICDSKSIRFRYHPELNFSKLGGVQKPYNQDVMVQHIGFMGEWTMNNPRHNAKHYDSDPAS